MKLDRFKGPALAATAVLLIAGATSALGAGRGPASPLPGASAAPTEPVGTDADTLQQGDQTTPDASGAAKPAVQAPGAAAESATPETGTEAPEASTAAEAASDGAGGHQDAAGQNVDHQFNGQE